MLRFKSKAKPTHGQACVNYARNYQGSLTVEKELHPAYLLLQYEISAWHFSTWKNLPKVE